MSFGADGSSSQATGSSWSQGENLSQASSQNTGGSQTTQGVWGPQGDALQGLYGAAQQGLQQAQQLGGQVMPLIKDTYSDLMSGGPGGALDAYGDRVGQIFNEQIMPGIQGDAIRAGALGGSRQGVAEGVAAGDARRQVQNFAGQQYQQNQDRRFNAANAMQGVPGMAMQPYQQMAGVVGGPQALTQSQAYNQGTTMAQAQGRNQSAAESQSSSFSFGANAGLW